MKKRVKIIKSGSVDSFDSMAQAATGLGIELRVLKAAKRAGCPGFRGSRVYGSEVKAWLAEHPQVGKASDLRERKLRAECDKIETANAVKKRELISRAWMAERVHVAFGKIDAFQQKSEAEHPLLFAAAADNVVQCREVIRKIWDEIKDSIQTLGKEFKE